MKKKLLLIFAFVGLVSLQTTAQLSEDFETDPPAGWTFAGTSGWIQTSARVNSGASSFYHNDNTSGSWDSWMISPAYSVCNDDELSFWYNQNFTGSWYAYSGVWISTASNDPIGNPGDFTELVELNGAAPGGFSEDTWTEHVQALAAYAGQTIYIAFRYIGGWDHETYIDDFSISTPSVSAVSLNNVLAVSGDVSWTASAAGETSWTVEYGVSGFALGSGTVLTVNTTPSTTISGLNPETAYDVYITPVSACSPFASMISFTTAPLCPTPINPSAVPSANDAVLSWNQGGAEVLWDVEWGAAGFVLGSGTLDNNLAAMSDNLLGLTGSTNYHWYVRSVCDVNTTDGVDTVSLWVGPEAFTTVPTCVQPTNLNATVNSANDADLDWTAGLETEWEIEYGMTGFIPGNGTASITNTNPTNVSGLTANTSYDYFVRAICAAGDTSAWSGPFTFMTPISCFDPTGLGISNLTTTSVDMNWTAGGVETEWMVEYGMNGFMPGSGTSVNVMTTPMTSITGLTAGTDYSFYVQSVCGTGDSSMWVGPFNFTTVISCPNPTGLNAINITTTAANLIWQAGGSEADWNIEWGSTGFTPNNGEEFGSVSATTDNPYYATGLNPSSTYEFYVQANCGAGDMSTWSGPYPFNTLLGNDMPCDAITVMVDAADTMQYNNIGATVDVNEGFLLPATTTYPDAAADGWFDAGVGNDVDNSVWFKFTAPASGIVTVSTASYMTTAFLDMAVYSTTDCNDYTAYTLLGANTLSVNSDPGGTNNPFGSEVVLCGLTSGQEYLVLVDGYYGNTANFGISVNSIATANAGAAVTTAVCTDGSVELFDFITGESDGNGVWYFPSYTDPGAQAFQANNGSMALTGLDFGVAYPFDYVVGSGCNMDVVSTTVTINEAVDAGGDGMTTTCISQDVDLQNHLVGVVPTGGEWIDTDNATGLVNEVFHTSAVAAGTYNFEYVLTNTAGTCSDTAVVTVTVDACLGVEETQTSTLEVYPNPVQDVLTIANLNVEGSAVITLVDVQGKIVYTKNITDLTGNFQLDLSDFENGVYIIEITSDSNTQKVRVVKH